MVVGSLRGTPRSGQSGPLPSSRGEWIGGDVAEGFGAVADAFKSNFVTRGEVGAAIAVYREGHKLVDLWGGWRDQDRGRRWDAETLVPVFSTTKGMSAAAMAVAHSRGLFQLDEPVASYWPEFAQHGKEGVTVRQLLAHEAGLAVIDQRLDLATIADPEQLGAVLAAQTPKWSPGTAHGYHAQTLGWYESQLLRRVDPARRSIGAFFADEVAAPLSARFFIGLTDDDLLEQAGDVLRWRKDRCCAPRPSDAHATSHGHDESAEHDGPSVHESEGSRDEHVEHQSTRRAAHGVPLDERSR